MPSGSRTTMFSGIVSVIRRSARSSSRNFSSACLRASISVLVPYHLTISPVSSRTGSNRAKTQRNAPSWRRRRPSNSPLLRRHDLGPLLAQLRKVFGVNRRLPSLPSGLVCRDTRIVLPTLVHEFVRAVGELAPGDRRDGVENRSTLRGVGVCGPRIRSGHARWMLSLRSLRPYGFAHSVPPQSALLDGDVKQAGQPALGVIP